MDGLWKIPLLLGGGFGFAGKIYMKNALDRGPGALQHRLG